MQCSSYLWVFLVERLRRDAKPFFMFYSIFLVQKCEKMQKKCKKMKKIAKKFAYIKNLL